MPLAVEDGVLEEVDVLALAKDDDLVEELLFNEDNDFEDELELDVVITFVDGRRLYSVLEVVSTNDDVVVTTLVEVLKTAKSVFFNC